MQLLTLHQFSISSAKLLENIYKNNFPPYANFNHPHIYIITNVHKYPKFSLNPHKSILRLQISQFDPKNINTASKSCRGKDDNRIHRKWPRVQQVPFLTNCHYTLPFCTAGFLVICDLSYGLLFNWWISMKMKVAFLSLLCPLCAQGTDVNPFPHRLYTYRD